MLMEIMNEAKLVEMELTLRNLNMNKEVMETRRSIVRWLALSLGVISPGESRLTSISVLDALLYFSFKERKDPDVPEMIDYITKAWGPINEKTLRYHLLQLKKMNITSNSGGKYSLVWPDIGEKYDAEGWVSGYVDRETRPIKEKLRMAVKELKDR
jgi:hypothetical protein